LFFAEATKLTLNLNFSLPVGFERRFKANDQYGYTQYQVGAFAGMDSLQDS
jgi:hypothetical protein